MGFRRRSPVKNPPLSLDGAYQQGYSDYTTDRPNPYTLGPLSEEWERGYAQHWRDLQM
jgi:hypothetical protein